MSYEIDREFLRRFKNSTVLLYTAMIITAVLGMLFKELPPIAMKLLLEYTSLGDVLDGDLFVGIFTNNIITIFLVFIVMVSFGEKYFKAFPKFYVIFNGIIGGAAIAYVAANANILYSIMLIIPHGILELAILCFALNSGYFFQKEGYTIHKKAKIFIGISSILILGVAAAAYIEVYITRDLASLFL